MDYDEIIVGAGSSGAVLAARLSEDSQRRILLIEAGPGYEDIAQTPGNLLDGRHLPWDHDWGLTAELVPGRTAPYQRGKVVGGCSSVNACIALRGAPADYDGWAAMGNPAWAWSRVLPAFIRLEDDPAAAGGHHGVGGPTPIHRCTDADLWPAQRAFLSACRELGFPALRDHNHPEASGSGVAPSNLGAGGIRFSTAIAYLLLARMRENLTILPGCLVDRVLFDGSRAVGVEAEAASAKQMFLGRRVTLCGGAIGSPAILLRSGIGDTDGLRALGVAPRHHLAGVGRNLIDHACLRVKWHAADGVFDPQAPHLQVLLSHTAPDSAVTNDMQAFLFQMPFQPALWLQTSLMKPRSRGSLTLHSTDPNEPPDISLNLASDPEDLRRLGAGLQLLAGLAASSALRALGGGPLVLNDGESISAPAFAARVSDDAWVKEQVRRGVQHYVHPVGTARMGPADDPGAVVDQYGRVHGTVGLRVVDASIMPTIPRANTHLTCIMLAERVAEWMREQDS